ncbi:MAG TPA: SPOR domain-containing protein, partial [Gemmatimonadaceae bacterium]
FLRENPQNAKRARTGLWLAQLLFDQSNDVQACGVLNQARAAIAPSDVELQNQMNFYSSRCAAAAANAAADSTARADSIKADSTARAEAHADSIRKAAAHEHEARARANKGKQSTTPDEYSVQMAAFATKSEADQFVARLQTRGVEGRVDGTQKPFRVRVGHYRTRAEAVKAAAQFKTLGLDGFITSADGR